MTGLGPWTVAITVTVVVGLFFAVEVQGRTLHFAQPSSGQCSRSCRLVYPWPPVPPSPGSPPLLLLEGDVTATRSSFIFSAASVFPPSTIAIAITNMAELALVSEFFSAQVLQEPSVHSRPAHHGTSGGIRLGAACCCGGGRRGRWCAVFAFEAACPSTRCHQSLAALARPFFSPPSPFPVLTKPSRVPASGCIGWHSERRKKTTRSEKRHLLLLAH